MPRVFRRRPSDDDLLRRVEAVEEELRRARREAAELRAAHDDAIDLALISAVPNSVFSLITDARANDWTVTYHRATHRDGYGTIQLEHPDDSAHNCSIELPLPDDPMAQRRIVMEIRMRVGWSEAA